MTKTVIIIFLYLTSLGCIAQTIKPAPTPITIEDFLKIKSFNEVLNLHDGYVVTSCEFVLVSKGDIFRSGGSGPHDLSKCKELISRGRAGDIVTLQATVKKGEKQLKLEAKQFILK